MGAKRGHLLEEGVSHLPARPRRSMCHPGRPMGFDSLDLVGSSVVLSPSHALQTKIASRKMDVRVLTVRGVWGRILR